jgi:hypothetical protein
MSDMYSMLSEPFPREMERQLKKGGTSLTYIPVSEVITRLNKVLGVDKWSFEIISCGRDALDPDYIVAHVRMTWYSQEPLGLIVRDGIGGQKIKRTKSGEIVDLGDEMKGAVSDALKKAAQTFGVGLYLARSEEAMLEEYAAEREQRVQDSINPEVAALWNDFVAASKTLDADQKSQLNDFWNEHSGGAPKPTKATASVEDLHALLEKALQIYMSSGSNE